MKTCYILHLNSNKFVSTWAKPNLTRYFESNDSESKMFPGSDVKDLSPSVNTNLQVMKIH